MLIQHLLVFFLIRINFGSRELNSALRTYCYDDRLTDTSNFITFGSASFPPPEISFNTSTSQWTDTRDEIILEVDDGYHQVPFDCRFGGQLVRNFCISANGPIYMGECPDTNDINPRPISSAPDDAWTGVAAFWDDFQPNIGGNIYYRKVSIEDNTPESATDLLIIANRVKATEVIREAHIITFHKMKNQNDKFECNVGVSFQYIIVPRETANDPYVYFAYGEFGWDIYVVSIGWNALHTPASFGFDFTEDFHDVDIVPQLAKRSYVCDGTYPCKLTDCPGKVVYDSMSGNIVCGDPEFNYDQVFTEVSVTVDTEYECTNATLQAQLTNLYPEVELFLDYAYQWSEVQQVVLQEISCQEKTVTDQNDNVITLYSGIQLVLTGRLYAWIEQGVFDDHQAAIDYLVSTEAELVSTPLTAMNILGELEDQAIVEDQGINSDLVSGVETTEINNTDTGLVCGWGREDVNNSCVNINECDAQSMSDICGETNVVSCTDQENGYTCQCSSGFRSVADTSSVDYDENYPSRGPFICEDIDECSENPGLCSETEECFNSEGSYSCEGMPPLVPELLVDPIPPVQLENITPEELAIEILIREHNYTPEEAGELIESVFGDHGCVCNDIFDSPFQPFDDLDRICKRFKACNSCMRRRFLPDCDLSVFTIDYFLVNTDLVTGVFECDEELTCESCFCRCAKNFAEELIEYLLINPTFTPQIRNDCETTNGGQGGRQCSQWDTLLTAK